ncbi:MAG: carboxypeptidase-like regulatory domain-containing protein [Myxococcota bacterium]
MRAYRLTLAGAIAIFGATVAPVAHAEPNLRVRGQSRIALERATGGLFGELRDDRGEAIAGAELFLTVRGSVELRRRLRTDGEGHFLVELPDSAGTLSVEARFDGDDYLLGHSVVRTDWNQTSPQRISLSINGDAGLTPVEIDLDGNRIETVARAENGAPPMRIVNELGDVLAEGRGAIEASLEATAFGAIGAGVIRVETMNEAGEPLSNRSRPAIRFRQPSLTLERSEGELAGMLRTSAGPLIRRAVTLENAERSMRFGTVLTDAEGRFAFAASLASNGSLVATFASTGPGLRSASSPVLELSPRPSFGTLWLLLPAVSLLLLFFLRPKNVPPTAPALAGGVSVAAPARRQGSTRVFGRIQRIPEGTPLPALVRARQNGETVFESHADESGRFSFELAEGSYELVFLAKGFASEFLAITIPRGGGEISVRLERWRQRAARILYDTAERVRGRRPQETIHALREDSALGHLAAQVEAVAYAPGERDGSSVGAVKEAADAIAPSSGPT